MYNRIVLLTAYNTVQRFDIIHISETYLYSYTLAVLYRSPSKTSAEFNSFQCNFDEILSNVKELKSNFLVILGDFNARSWWSHDNPTNEGVQTESLISTYHLHQLVSHLFHLLSSSCSCIDLFFTDHQIY